MRAGNADLDAAHGRRIVPRSELAGGRQNHQLRGTRNQTPRSSAATQALHQLLDHSILLGTRSQKRK
jgi:hypothetical protein